MIVEHLLLVAREGLLLALWLAGPPLGAALLAGFATSVLQAATQIQEPSLTFLPRLVAAAVALAATGPWMLRQLVRFARVVFESISWVA